MPTAERESAPSFSLLDQDGTHHSLADYAGRHVLLVLFARTAFPVCGKAALVFRDLQVKLARRNIFLLGCSPDGIDVLKSFGEKNQLNFPLLSDSEGEVKASYSIQRSWPLGLKLPALISTTWIDPEGMVVRKWGTNTDGGRYSRIVFREIELPLLVWCPQCRDQTKLPYGTGDFENEQSRRKEVKCKECGEVILFPYIFDEDTYERTFKGLRGMSEQASAPGPLVRPEYSPTSPADDASEDFLLPLSLVWTLAPLGLSIAWDFFGGLGIGSSYPSPYAMLAHDFAFMAGSSHDFFYGVGMTLGLVLAALVTGLGLFVDSTYPKRPAFAVAAILMTPLLLGGMAMVTTSAVAGDRGRELIDRSIRSDYHGYRDRISARQYAGTSRSYSPRGLSNANIRLVKANRKRRLEDERLFFPGLWGATSSLVGFRPDVELMDDPVGR